MDHLPIKKSRRIIMFYDLRDSTDILLNFEQGLYRSAGGIDGASFTYEKFILDFHRTAYEELYLGHNNTYSEIYGDGLMAIFPEDNVKYILENIYRLTKRMRAYNDATGVGVLKPSIDIGFGITMGESSLIYYHLDRRHHPVGISVHEAARIEGVSKFYDARVLISKSFFKAAEGYISSDPRFAYRFIDRVRLKSFREPITLYELLIDNDPRFENKLSSIPLYRNGYAKFCNREWSSAKEIFLKIQHDFGLGIGLVMAKRCDILAQNPPGADWKGIWKMKDK